MTEADLGLLIDLLVEPIADRVAERIASQVIAAIERAGQDGPGALTRQQAAGHMAMSLSMLDDMVGRGEIPVVSPPNCRWRRFRVESLDAWLRANDQRRIGAA